MARRISIHEDENKTPKFTIDQEITRQYRRFTAMGAELTMRPQPSSDDDDTDPISHFTVSVNEVIEYALRNCEDSDLVGVTIRNKINVPDKAVGISFRRKDQLSGDVIWPVFEKVVQSNARFGALDKLTVTVHAVRLP
jgi:hypothetical protein